MSGSMERMPKHGVRRWHACMSGNEKMPKHGLKQMACMHVGTNWKDAEPRIGMGNGVGAAQPTEGI